MWQAGLPHIPSVAGLGLPSGTLDVCSSVWEGQGSTPPVLGPLQLKAVLFSGPVGSPCSLWEMSTRLPGDDDREPAGSLRQGLIANRKMGME